MIAAVLLVLLAIFVVKGPSENEEQQHEERNQVDSRTPLERASRPGPGLSKPGVPPEKAEAFKEWDLAKPRVSPHATGSDEHVDWIEEQIADLRDKQWYNDDPVILNEVMANLRSPEPELREVALEAVVNLSSRDAIPYLERAAILAETPEEQRALIEAAEYLKLPTIFEGRAQRKKEREEAAAKEATAQ
ncbi:hypothetical protein [Haloferula sp.]|uniref:hypothetical protein n=1 Tax=Haloferula sp. TaxID=2497595 RepID=UPI00329DEA1F